ncbi:hypothetical protein [Streptomyces sp. NPDC005805]|uniref:hypothetical protein n=1 Tax=Streptomyces sp. NPDC005805 TaxID=3157068 RepID=UPI0033E1C1E3
MSGRVSGGAAPYPRGRAVVASVAVASAVLLAGCGAGAGGDGPPSQSVSAAAERERAAPAVASTPAGEVPELRETKTLPVSVPANDVLDEPATSAEVTLNRLRQADRIAQGEYLEPIVADPGTTFVCLEFRVRNTGDAEFDTGPLSRARWTGQDGETKQADLETSGNCVDLGFTEENLISEPHPRPGEFVEGTVLFAVSDEQDGLLEFSDGLERPLFTVKTTAAPR